jgi:AcrR family transcriptional regulator
MNDSNAAGTDTRAGLLRAGRKLFAERGYDGTSVRAITGEAGANLGAVTYHFGSKEELYRAVLHDVLGPLPSLIEEVVTGQGTVIERVDGVARTYVRFLASNPEVPRFLMQEIAAGKVPPAPVMEILGRVAGMLAAMLRQGQVQGDVRAGDPLLLTLTLVSQPVYFALVRRAIASLTGRDPMAGDRLAALEDHVATAAVAALAAGRSHPTPHSQRRNPR